MIEVQNVSMRFNLGIEKNNSLKQMAVDLFSRKARQAHRKEKSRMNFGLFRMLVLQLKKEKYLDLSDQTEQGNQLC